MQTENFTLGKKELLILLGLILVLPFPINWALIELNPLTLMAGADDVPTWIGSAAVILEESSEGSSRL